MKAHEKTVAMYYDWINNFLTRERFAEYYGITLKSANRLIATCHKIFD